MVYLSLLIKFIFGLIKFSFIFVLFNILNYVVMNNKLPSVCPSCSQELVVSELACGGCSTKVSGSFPLPVLLGLTPDEQQFVLDFFLSSGSLKEMAQKMGNSYPTVRNKLDDMITKIKYLKNK